MRGLEACGTHARAALALLVQVQGRQPPGVGAAPGHGQLPGVGAAPGRGQLLGMALCRLSWPLGPRPATAR
jgi:hypothetical protein